MKTTLEIPDDLFRRAKAAAALQGRPLKDLVADGLRKELDEPPVQTERPLTLHDRMKDLCGFLGNDAPTDLATNPKYMEGFGE